MIMEKIIILPETDFKIKYLSNYWISTTPNYHHILYTCSSMHVEHFILDQYILFVKYIITL